MTWIKKGTYTRAAWVEVILSVVVLVGAIRFISDRLNVYELRQGVLLHDPILQHLPPINFNWAIFMLLYGAIIMMIILLIPTPRLLSIGLQAYAISLLIRTMSVYLTPLEPPEGIIYLYDPLVIQLGTHVLINKDLLFSGHLCSMAIFFFVAPWRWLKCLMLCIGLLMSVLILCQHVHYTIDLFVAVFVAYGSYRLVYCFHTYVETYLNRISLDGASASHG